MKKWILFLVCIASAFLSSCGLSPSEKRSDADIGTAEEGTMLQIRHDTEKLKEWFPKLSGIVSAEWEAYEDGQDEYFDLPSPSSLTAKGYIFLNQETAEKCLDAYEWNASVPDVQMKFVSSEKLESGKWMFSWQFDQDFRPRSWIGHFWFDGETILFDVGK